MPQNPEVSVIVCHHTGTLIFGFLKSLFKSKEVTLQVIVISSDKELVIKGIDNCITLYSEALPAEKRNAAARIAKADYIAFFDDDVEIDELCLYHLLSGFSNDVAMTYGKLWNMEHRNRFDEAGGYLTWTGFIWSRAGQNDIDHGQFNKEEYILAGKSASCMVRKDVFKEVGGFDESFGILGEETDLSWRIWLSGRKVLYMPDATGYHAFNTRFKPVEKHYTSRRVHFNGCRNYITMLIKNLGKEHLWILLIHIPIWVLAGIMMLLTGKRQEGLNILKGLKYVLDHRKEILEKRSQTQGGRRVSDKTIWPHIFARAPRGYYSQRFRRYCRTGLHG